MGQYSNPKGGMYLVESPEDVLKITVKDESNLSFMTQTTLSVDDTSDVIDALRSRFPKIIGPRKDDICYATTNRQEAVRALAEEADVVLVVGSKNSSNSNRLAELAQRMGKKAYLIDDASDIDEAWLQGAACVGVTAGASAPDILVQNVLKRLQALGGSEARELTGREENIVFEELRMDVREEEEPQSRAIDYKPAGDPGWFFLCSVQRRGEQGVTDNKRLQADNSQPQDVLRVCVARLFTE